MGNQTGKNRRQYKPLQEVPVRAGRGTGQEVETLCGFPEDSL